MTELICRKSMARCLTPGMCSPHGGCQPDKTEWQSGYDEGRRMGTKCMCDEVNRLKAENAGFKTGYQAYEAQNAALKAEVEALRKDAERYRLLRPRHASGDIRISVEYANTRTGMRVLIDGEQLDSIVDGSMGKGEQP